MVPTCVRSYSKINLGLAIGAPRPDGFHALATLYQTLALHDLVTVSARRTAATRIVLRSNDPRVPRDARNTAWKMVEKALARLDLHAEVVVHIQKNLPIQGGMGAGSANAAAALIGLERELRLELDQATRVELAAQVGSDVPLFLLGGSVLGTDRGQAVSPVADVSLDGSTEIACVMALPQVGVSTPAAFRDWDQRFTDPDLHNPAIHDKVEQLSRTYASVFTRQSKSLSDQSKSLSGQSKSGASGIFPDPTSAGSIAQTTPENLQGLSREQHHASPYQGESGIEDDSAENSLLALVRTGIENDFETVVFPQYPFLREIKRHLMGSSDGSPDEGTAAVIAALSGSGSALFGLYRTQTDASAAQQRLQQQGVEAIVTKTMPRARYWSEMFAE